MSSRKSDGERPIVPPIDFHPPSNGEFCPTPPTERSRRMHELYNRIVEEKHRRLGMTRRQFAESACGMAAALYVVNVCGSSEETGQNRAGPGGSGGSGGSGGTAGRGGSAGSGGAVRDASPEASDSASYDVTPDMLEDVDAARDRLSGNEFIFDVQTHVFDPARAVDGKDAARTRARFHQADLRPERHHRGLRERHSRRARSRRRRRRSQRRAHGDHRAPGRTAHDHARQCRPRARAVRARPHGRCNQPLQDRRVEDLSAPGLAAARQRRARCAVHRSSRDARRARDRRPPRHQWRRRLRGRGLAGRRGARGEAVPEREFSDLPLGVGARRRREPSRTTRARRTRPASTA